jgi:hypothetical protein
MVAVAWDFRRAIHCPIQCDERIFRLAADDECPADSVVGSRVVRVQGSGLPSSGKTFVAALASYISIEPRQGESRIGG